MGCCQTFEQQSQTIDRQLDRELRDDSYEDRKKRKILLIGANGSGKSTIIKQLRIIHGRGFTQKDRIEYKKLIYNQCIQQMKMIIQFINNKTIFDSQYLRAINTEIKSYEMQCTDQLNAICSALKYLWKHQSIQSIYNNRNNLTLNLIESTAYFINDIDKYFASEYIPTREDILLVYDNNQSSVSEYLFEMEHCPYLIIDVHQKTKNINKWIHCFDYMTCVIFVLSLSCYDSSSSFNLELLVSGYVNEIFNEQFDIPIDLIILIAMFCPPSLIANKMEDQIALFHSIWYNEFLQDTCMVVFFNKKDEFAIKLEKTPINICRCFKDFDPDAITGSIYDSSIQYIKAYVCSVEDKGRHIFCHETIAKSTSMMDKVFNNFDDGQSLQNLIGPYRLPQSLL